MKQPLLFTALIFSGLSANAQNLVTQTQVVNYTNIQGNTQQYANNQQNFAVNINYDNNSDEQVQTNRGRGSSAMQSFGNSGNNTNKEKKTTSNNKIQVQTKVNNVANDDNVNRGNRGNNFEINENILINDIDINSNPVANNKKTVANKPIVQDAPGLAFKPSGLSGRDYSNGGKLKKGQKNFYTQAKTKHKSYFKRKPGNKKVKHHTSKCAKW